MPYARVEFRCWGDKGTIQTFLRTIDLHTRERRGLWDTYTTDLLPTDQANDIVELARMERLDARLILSGS